MLSILKGAAIRRLLNRTSAGATPVNSTSVDRSNFDVATFIAIFQTLASGQVTSLKVQHSDDNTDWTDVDGAASGALADTDGNKMIVVEVETPTKRYLRAVVVRGTANAAIDGVVVILSRGARLPVTQSADHVAKQKHAVGV